MLNVVNEAPGISTRRYQCKWRELWELQLSAVCTGLPCESNVLTAVVRILTSLHLWYVRYLQMKYSLQKMNSRIFTFSICGLMKIHMWFFRHMNSNGSPTYGPVFVAIIYSNPTYFQTGLQDGIYKAVLQNNMPDFLADSLTIRWELRFMQDGAPAQFSLVTRRYLNWKFPGQWTGRGGPIAWPPHSSDLNPLDFCSWGHVSRSCVRLQWLMRKCSEIELWQFF
jgi:hypothetical protein